MLIIDFSKVTTLQRYEQMAQEMRRLRWLCVIIMLPLDWWAIFAQRLPTHMTLELMETMVRAYSKCPMN